MADSETQPPEIGAAERVADVSEPVVTRDAAAVSHVISVGVDLSPALAAQGYDESSLVNAVAEACRKGGGDAPIPAETAEALQTVSKVLTEDAP